PPQQVIAPRTGDVLVLGPPPGFNLEALLNAPSLSSGDSNVPTITGDAASGYRVIGARQLSNDESHMNAARVQGYVFDPSYLPLSGIPMRVCWSGGCLNGATGASGYYEFILSPGIFTVGVVSGGQSATFRTDLPEAYGHYTYVISFQASR